MKKAYVIVENKTGAIMGRFSWIDQDYNSKTDKPSLSADIDIVRGYHASLASDPNESEITEEYIYSGYYHTEEQTESLDLDADDSRIICSDGWLIATGKLHPEAVPANGRFVSISGEAFVFVTEE